MAEEKQRVALPSEVYPTHYDLDLKVDFDNFSFLGKVDVALTVEKAVDKLQFHSCGLEISSATVTQGDNKFESLSATLNEEEETGTIDSVDLQPGDAKLTIQYKGTFTKVLKGFYRSTWKLNGEDRSIGTTQFEPVDARRAFPCWDEPARKATFNVTITAPKDLCVISNMPEISNTVDGTLKTVSFDKTPKMSTYLLAWCIGDFESVEMKTKNGTLIRAFSTIGKKDKLDFAMKCCADCLPVYEELFDIKYPLPKLDIIGIPDFSAGAMENWGLVTCREVEIFCDETTAAKTRERITLVMCHELAHQWFGNLVTMEWWSQLWLNEGFAEFIRLTAMMILYPDWHPDETFVVSEYERALELDGTLNTHAIEVDVYHPKEIDEIFDAISYFKGCSVLRMCSEYLTSKVFIQGVRDYLNSALYGNAVTTDLWKYLDQASGKDVTGFMSVYTREEGFPVITVTEEANSDPLVLTLKQNRFLSSGKPTAEQDKVTWKIPILVTTSETGKDGKPLEFFMSEKETTITLPAGTKWYKLNSNASGFFRVNYSPESRARLKQALQQKEVTSSLDRLNVVSDVTAMAKSGYYSVVDVLDILSSFANEDNPSVWAAIVQALESMQLLIGATGCDAEFRKYVSDLFSNIFKVVGWERSADESLPFSKMRDKVISMLCGVEVPEVAEEARRRYNEWLANPKGDEAAKVLPSDLRSGVFAMVMSSATPADFEALSGAFEAATSSEEGNMILRSFGSAQNKETIQKVLDYTLSGKIRDQDAVWAVVSMDKNPEASELALAWLKEHFDLIQKKFPSFSFVKRFLSLVKAFHTEEKANEVEAFFKTKSGPGLERPMQGVVESIRANAAWFARDLDKTKEYLKSL